MADFKGMLQQSNLIGGAWCNADNGATLDVCNPANGIKLGTIPNCGAVETGRAITAASTAFTDWSSSDLSFRVNLLHKLHDALMDNQNPLAHLLTAEQGKPLAEAMGEIAIGAAYIRWFAEEVRRAKGEIIPAPSQDRQLLVTRHPVGVVGAITPWNFPSSMLARKLGPALAAGCAMVARPAEDTPLSALAMGVLAERAGIPVGVLSILPSTASSEIGKEFCENPVVRKLTFTGSTQVGRILLRQAADQVMKCSMELGGNAPFIVFDDADIDAAVDGAIMCKFRNAGQTCVCANRIYVQAGVYDEFAEKLAAKVGAMSMGDALAGAVDFGPLINPKATEKVHAHIADAKAKGATVILGDTETGLSGNFITPTIVTGATKDMAFSTDETFGPLAPLFKFADEDEVIALANDTIFGLASYFYANDLSRVYKVAEALEYGIVGVNTGIISTEVAPFGGVKQSGLGREGSHHGIEDYLEMKYICMAV